MTDMQNSHDVRVALLESGVTNINEKLSDMKVIIERVAVALERLATIEERQNNTNDSLNRAFIEIEENDHRIADIEMQMPELIAIKTWVVRGVLAIVGVVGLGTISAVFSMAFMARRAAGG